MSEFASSLLTNSVSSASAEASPGTSSPLTSSDPQKSTDSSTFTELFASLDPESATADDSLLAESGNLPPLTDVNLPNTTAVAIPDQLGETGNILPQSLPSLSINGFIAQSNQNGAAVIPFVGDGQQLLLATTPKLAAGLTPAVLQAQTQLQEGLEQPLQNPQLSLKDAALAGQNRPEIGKQVELFLDNMMRQADQADETHIPRATLSTNFLSLHSHSMAMFETSAATSRTLHTMTASLQQPHWNEQIGDRLNLMISRGLQQAEIRLNPPELGMLEVKIQIQGDQANVHFSTPHGQVKEALDAAIPRLREMLEDNGLTLGDVNISQQSLAQGQSQSGDDAGGQSATRSDNNNRDQLILNSEQSDKDIMISGEIGLVDVFV
mgnify:CR=1 FL=1